MWGAGELGGAVYMFDEISSKWVRLADGDERWAKLAVYRGEMVSIGGFKGSVRSGV